MLSYIKTPRALVINIDGEPFNIKSSHANYKRILDQTKLAHGSQEDADVEELKLILKPIHRLIYNSEYKIEVDENGNLYLGGIEEMLPKELAEYISEAVEEKGNVESLVNFCKLLMLNPDPAVRTQLFSFLQHNGHPITKHGYFVAYKYVSVKEAYVSKQVENIVEDTIEGLGTTTRATGTSRTTTVKADSGRVKGADLSGYSERVTAAKAKAIKQKRSAKRFYAFVNVADETDLIFKFFDKGKTINNPFGYDFLDKTSGKIITLDDLYKDLMNTNSSADDFTGEGGIPTDSPKKEVIDRVKDQIKSTTFTDSYTKTMDIKLGDTVSMPRIDCNPDPTVTCSTGLHVGSMDYVGGSDLILNCLISPEDVVSIPKDYNNTKMRCCKYYAFSINHEEFEKKYTDIDYHEITKQELQRKLQEKIQGSDEARIIASVVSESKVIA